MGIRAGTVMKGARGRTDAEQTPLTLRARRTDGDDLRSYARKRAGFKLGKFASRIERVTVRLDDESGPKGAPLSVCSVKVVISRLESVVVTAADADVRAALDTALDGAERAVRRTVERAKSRARRR